ncbi:MULTISPECIES: prolipoprotein diacylglyceryl transferase [Heyndrickxia]|jgi:phosphatidylglycerol:prolipoprotein diacylglycerol transferase|uniref:Phosphatidylglycerol--prolipoprotein diacylglyceryl transferase n=1 Tax=Heyndrickxia coagulans TaxID=1398 RepID=A0A150JVJ1_HEYCO|nr:MULTISPECIES: prolipoprotein diacylglyceryl transferase [Heyndrickxia]AEH53126.1 prolipoprotein diacylglyceryl transferase [Heyndrickxia coagulans 2-6]KYC61262.1 hypothetical protein B4098_3447 [Heyndrickxia coagulans]MEC2306717.1 prolipoprotein diacylglyceryl transferase [Weizmannia sp. CD-2023]MEC2342478.1 prolipoprotein diacylglyceryl transferase [Weizmannia sp. CD-2023]MEC5270388.1 prolipoprotein diacylglyceryl transferase [Heyndrickxia coagulans]
MTQIEPLNKIAFQLGTIEVHWYGIIIGFGVILGYLLATREAKKLELKDEIIADFLIWALPVSILSARAYYVIFEWDYYREHLNEIIAIWNGGIAIHGAVLGGIITAIVYTKRKGISFWKLADIVAPSLILGQAIGRWGNFVNQEAHGGIVSRSFLEHLKLPDFIINQMYIDGNYYQPTFLYESTWDLLGFVFLLFLRRTNIKRGEVFLSYLIWYSVGRFFVEGLRTDSLMLTSDLRMAQVVSISLILFGVTAILYRRKKGYAAVKYKEVEQG